MADEYTKTPNGELVYTFGWAKWLAEIGDTINAHTITAHTVSDDDDPGITIASHGHTTTEVTVRLEGGTVGVRYRIDCQITTALSGEVDEWSLFLDIVEYK